jgi:hypothetical protein
MNGRERGRRWGGGGSVGEVRLELCCVGLAMDLECKARSSFRAEGKASAPAVSRGQARASIALLEFGEGAAANPHRERWWVTSR